MRAIEVNSDRIPEAASTLARATVDEPSGRYLLPDRDEFLAVYERIHAAIIERTSAEGQVHAWGDPFVGVAVWLSRPGIDEPATQPTFAAVLREPRQRARPDPYAYLDTVARWLTSITQQPPSVTPHGLAA